MPRRDEVIDCRRASLAPPAATIVPTRHGAARCQTPHGGTQAIAIVERHATYSAAGGIIPVPLVNVASVTAIIVRMVRR